MRRFITASFLLFLTLTSQTWAQMDSQPVYSWYDRIVGLESSGLINGVEYVEQHRVINDRHKFFLQDQFFPGFLIYNGQPYHVLLKYNVYDQVLLAQVEYDQGKTILQLIDEKINRFEIQGHQFINLAASEGSRISGFYEILLHNPHLSLLKKHSLEIKQRLDKNFVYYEFDKLNNDLILWYDDAYFTIGSRRDLIQVFPDLKKEIRQFYRDHSTTRKADPEKFMINLLQKVNSLLSEPIALQE